MVQKRQEMNKKNDKKPPEKQIIYNYKPKSKYQKLH